ncbi:DUF2070 family protein [Nitrososphaera sp.]|uniref:DUF2070 family protein n=1 Tax=Nitrososphaera sp. TaxID=1971748 RepID=UPI00307CD762
MLTATRQGGGGREAGGNGDDDVSNIHRRWSFARLTPTTLRASFAMTLACAGAIIAASHIFHLGTGLAGLAVHLPAGLAATAGLAFLDFAMLRGTPVNKLSKVVHVSSFANLLWALTVLAGALANAVFAKQGEGYIVAGMFLAAGLRVGIFTSVFGAGVLRAVAICLVAPVLFALSFIPPQYYAAVLVEPVVGLAFGALFVALAITWAIIADRAGRPQVESTFRLLQAFLSAWTENKTDGMEEYFESKARSESVSTKVLTMVPVESAQAGAAAGAMTAAIVLPDVHPGPFGNVGGSNLPHVLHERFSRRALVMHSVSDHSLNIPSGKEVSRYVAGLDRLQARESGSTCSEPVQRRQGSATATGIAFGRSALLMLSLAPKGMEDVPDSVRDELESHAARLGFGNLMLVDCHNAMGDHIGDGDRADLLAAAKACLDGLKDADQGEFLAGMAVMQDDDDVSRSNLAGSVELGKAGLVVLALRTATGRDFAIAWADSNNMENSVRDRIVAAAAATTTAVTDSAASGTATTTATTMVAEACSSDTHATSGKKGAAGGYFPLGSTQDSREKVAVAFSRLARLAMQRAQRCRFELAAVTTEVKVMGSQFGDYSSALDRSMGITKAFVGVTCAAFIALQILA